MRRIPVCLAAGAVLACSGGGGTNLSLDTAAPEQAAAEVSAEPEGRAEPDVWRAVEVEPELAFEIEPEVPRPECRPGEGCFRDRCDVNTDCQSGWCVQHMGDGRCSQQCTEECPEGWSCAQAQGTGPDLVYVCVSNFANLCRPCAANVDCGTAAGTEDVCVDYGEQGSFCGGACVVSQDCPWGFSCKESPTVDGIIVRQCVSDTGVCPCASKSVELAAWTPCQVVNEYGSCNGMRVCTAEGLSDCDAATPEVETCNGADDNCNEQVDEPLLVRGKYKELCDDGNDCTVDTCNAAAGCSSEPTSGGECKDGDPCTVGDHCETGQCTGMPVLCDDGNACTDDLCDGLGGCKTQLNTADCDDGDPCTVKDTCEQGECSGYAVDCACLADADCGKLDDGNLCNGTLFCDKSKLPYSCAIKEGSLVTCPAPAGPDAICKKSACIPEAGKCAMEPDHDGYACNDGDLCTIGDACADGACQPGADLVCADNNPCTDDWCENQLGCVFENNSNGCFDGNVCTLDDQCAAGQCVGGPAKQCDDGNACTDDACDPSAGCVFTPNATGCDDGNACTSGDHCALGVCAFAGFVSCADTNACTTDSCDAATGCVYVLNTAACDDGNPCTSGDACKQGACTPGAKVVCDDGNPCTDDSCQAPSGCVFKANASACTDANACTLGDHCADKTCVFDSAADCNDKDVCTTDYCDPKKGCVHELNTAPCDDGNVCTTGDACSNGVCKPSGSFTCADGNACTDDQCDPKQGCLFPPNQKPCSDGTVCTVDDQCADGKCVPGKVLQCDDGAVCTADSCDALTGCVQAPVAGACDDKDACTTGDKCLAGACAGGAPLECVDANPCTKDGCDKVLGCQFLADNAAACTDGNACTTGDYCQQGQCKSTGTLTCTDGNECTSDACDPAAGCKYTPVADNTPCKGGGQWKCLAGECKEVAQHGSQTFTYTGGAQTFTVPAGISSVVVVTVGGGGGGCGSHYGGGGSGWVLRGQHNVSGTVNVTVGNGGSGGVSGTNDAPGGTGQASSFGALVSAPGGNGCPQYGGGGSGGSGGGGGGNSGCAGAGGSGGAKGQDGCTTPGGAGGHFDSLAGLTQHNLTAGAGGAAGQSSHSGGGGAGGVLVDGAGPKAGDGGAGYSGKGGQGYGAGGGAGGYTPDVRPPGGAGAPGLVYVEW